MFIALVYIYIHTYTYTYTYIHIFTSTYTQKPFKTKSAPEQQMISFFQPVALCSLMIGVKKRNDYFGFTNSFLPRLKAFLCFTKPISFPGRSFVSWARVELESPPFCSLTAEFIHAKTMIFDNNKGENRWYLLEKISTYLKCFTRYIAICNYLIDEILSPFYGRYGC